MYHISVTYKSIRQFVVNNVFSTLLTRMLVYPNLLRILRVTPLLRLLLRDASVRLLVDLVAQDDERERVWVSRTCLREELVAPAIELLKRLERHMRRAKDPRWREHYCMRT